MQPTPYSPPAFALSHPPRAAGTAKVLILIGLALQVIEVAVLVALGLVLLIAPLLTLLFLPLAAIGVLWVVLVYLFSYRRVAEGDYAGASTPTLVFAILSLLTVNLVSGVLYIVAYVEISRAQDELRARAYPAPGYPPAPAWGPPPMASPAPGPGVVYCRYCGRANAPTMRFCGGCGAPLAA